MHLLKRCLAVGGVLAALLLAAAPARAVIVIGNGDGSGRNPVPDPNNLSQFEGLYAQFTATAIAPSYAIVAKHTGTAIPVVEFNGTFYHIAQEISSPNSDLKILRIDGSSTSTGTIIDPNARIPTFAPLYTAGNELADSNLTIFGRGVGKGAVVPGQGWQWSTTTDGLLSWGTNNVAAVLLNQFDTSTHPPTPLGDLIQFNFTNTGNNVGTLAQNDSGGGVFILDHGTWKLAGVNFGVDGPYFVKNPDGSFSMAFPSSAGFAALYDTTGFYLQNDTGGFDPATGPQGSYATRIASTSNLAFISAVTGIAVPEPSSLILLGLGLAGGFAVARSHRRRFHQRTDSEG
jgi:hypothetical protein